MDNEVQSSTYLAINVLIHVIILFSFLCVFFFAYVSKIEGKAFQDELGNMIEQDLGKILNENQDVNIEIKKFTPLLKRLQTLYDKPDRFTQERNKMLKIIAMVIIGGLFVLLGAIFFTVKFDCHKNIDIKPIIFENIILFIFVGITEYIFFTNIAIKYIPTKPSLLVNTMINTLKEQLSK
jgi:hypothetical protein